MFGDEPLNLMESSKSLTKTLTAPSSMAGGSPRLDDHRSLLGRISPEPSRHGRARSLSPNIMAHAPIVPADIMSSRKQEAASHGDSSEDDFVILENEDVNDNIKVEEERSAAKTNGSVPSAKEETSGKSSVMERQLDMQVKLAR